MQRRHPNRSRDMRGPANWQERNERAYWGSDEHDLPHYDDLLLPDDERDIDFQDARERLPAERFDARRERGEHDARHDAGDARRARGAADEGGRERDARRDPVRVGGGPARPAAPSEREHGGHAGEHAARRDARYGDAPRHERNEQHAWQGGGHGAPSHARYDPPPTYHPRHAERRAQPLRGPKGYTRSDERIREDVCERLAFAIDIDVSEVSVAVEAGCVRLDGTVPERWMKHEIEDLADSCVWVRDVDNRVRVVRGRMPDDVPQSAARGGSGSGDAPLAGPDPAAQPSGAIGPAGPAQPDAATVAPGPDDRRH
ncbi:BON domain-containing protein [Burkholderia sp. 22PA0099]|uniref:BON domain-containing protein n=1 Tax=Burkholderia sp. 22PA0099 TaxID=3237372 RepID=UPI0039C24DE3